MELEAQQQAVRDFLARRGEVLEAFTEIESARKHDRPQLATALAACKKHKAALLIPSWIGWRATCFLSAD